MIPNHHITPYQSYHLHIGYMIDMETPETIIWSTEMPSIEISEKALAYLKNHAEPLTDTTVSVLDRLLAEHAVIGSEKTTSKLEMRFGSDALPSVKFTTITSATISGKAATQKSWNHVLEDVIRECVARGATSESLKSTLLANTVDGAEHQNGYRYIKEANLSFQGLEANRVCKNIAVLTEKYPVKVDIMLKWQNEEKAQFPGQSARIILP